MIDKNAIKLYVSNNSKKNKIQIISDNKVYVKKSKDELLRFYYLIL